MTFTDYIGFASMTLLIVGAVNWGCVAIRYSMSDLPDADSLAGITDNTTKQELYELVPTPDLLDLLQASPAVQMFVYYTVFLSGIIYLGLFAYNSVEVQTVDA